LHSAPAAEGGGSNQKNLFVAAAVHFAVDGPSLVDLELIFGAACLTPIGFFGGNLPAAIGPRSPLACNHYAFEGRSSWFVLAFAGTCVLASIYGFLQGAWPFGIVEGIWALVALRRWQKQAALA
jgi:hypothetical protein